MFVITVKVITFGVMKQDKVYQIRLSETLLDKAHKAAEKKNTKLSKAVKDFINEFINS